jgi:type I restriction-modification system DNA methylase subunit
MEKSLELVRQLVSDFREHEKAYLSPTYQESQVRQDFIDKFFTALGWDVSHQRQKNPYEQEVKIENRMRTEGTQRRADYAFFIAPNFRDVKFFVEAKKPAHDLANANYYYQTVRYGWNKTTPIAILTDFEEFHILDCRYKPDIKNALNYKIETFHYSQYTDEEIFKKIFYLFGRDAVAGGSLEKYAGTLTKPRGKAGKKGIVRGKYQQVDEAFLELLDGYRDTLAHAFKNKNPNLDGESLTEAVQRTLDRLVFIRFLEDKGIEEPMIINLVEKQLAWGSFITLCRSMEPKYNGLVFKQHPVIDSPTFIAPDDKMFGEICGELSDPTSPYDFNTIPISILGSIYERFLGKIVTTTDKRAKVVEKPEVRKAGGVYYTPEYIVRYIVNETVGKLLYQDGHSERSEESDNVKEDSSSRHGSTSLTMTSGTQNDKMEVRKLKLTPAEVAKLKIIDIACGSGSFLLEVYSQLLDYHTRYYNEFPEKAKKGDTETREGKIVLSHKKRQEILVNNIYGVDIDFQATEVTQLSLYLKLMEDVTMNDAYQFSLLKERMLPDLRRHIVCGNSLIGRDILDGKLFDDETEHTLKPMNFEDAFPEIMNPSTRSGGEPVRRSPESRKLSGRDEGGFDVVVGNPPYVDIKGLPQKQVEYIFSKYPSANNRINLFAAFIERSLQIVKKSAFRFSMIIPTAFLIQDSYTILRRKIVDGNKIESIVRLPNESFGRSAGEVKVDTAIVVFSETKNSNSRTEIIGYQGYDRILQIDPSNAKIHSFINQSSWASSNDCVWSFNTQDIENDILLKCEKNSVSLESCTEISLGITPYDKYKGHTKQQIENQVFHADNKKNETFKKLLAGNDVMRYFIKWNEEKWISYGPWLGALRDKKFFTSKRILIKQIIDWGDKRIWASITDEELYNSQNAFNLIAKEGWNLEYLLGLLNSRLMSFYHRKKFLDEFKMRFQKILIKDCRRFPIHTINFDDAADKAHHDHIVSLVEQMLTAKAKHTAATTESEKNRLDIQIEALDRQIDNAVYELYGLTEEEIKIVEGR